MSILSRLTEQDYHKALEENDKLRKKNKELSDALQEVLADICLGRVSSEETINKAIETLKGKAIYSKPAQ
jgi:hypothetical protein